jgi:hypothetical protein
MNDAGVLAITIQVLAGISLAACCGLRAFLPPFVLGLGVRMGLAELVLGRPVVLHDEFEWLASTPALVVFGVAVVAELLADKIPVVDHLLDLVQTLVRPLAGALVVAASLTGLEPLPAAVIGLVVGGSLAGGVHAAKSNLRLFSTAGTAGAATPAISLAEDVAATAGSLLAVKAAVVAATLLLLAGAAAGLLALRLSRGRARHRAASAR